MSDSLRPHDNLRHIKHMKFFIIILVVTIYSPVICLLIFYGELSFFHFSLFSKENISKSVYFVVKAFNLFLYFGICARHFHIPPRPPAGITKISNCIFFLNY